MEEVLIVDIHQRVFIELLRAGLWEQNVRLSPYKDIDFSEVYRIAEEQSVIGLVAAGFEHVSDIKVPQQWALQFVGYTIQLEQRNKAMNAFIAKLIEKFRKEDIYTLLVKGQGVAQCYERPLWRASGDVDLYLSKDNYEKAKKMLLPVATNIEKEERKRLHLGMTVDGWVVELHGTMHTKLSRRMNRVADEVHRDLFFNGNIKSWNDNGVQVFLPSANNDVIIIFNHIINHFFLEGVGLRQICDWCRLLYSYKDSLNHRLLESRIKKMGLMTEWKALAALAVNFLGMPAEAMPFYESSRDRKFKRKADRILEFVMESGNFGHNRDTSYKQKYPIVIRYAMSFWLYTKLAMQRFAISPRNAIMAWWAIIKMGANAAAKAI